VALQLELPLRCGVHAMVLVLVLLGDLSLRCGVVSLVDRKSIYHYLFFRL
jgi:hypothetical protein